ncbi:uncharacterized protein BDV17DRAFT_264020 [Aspergillus undulatus]|uniref:uncharacterized protein n=1 Tax=Aspergillus undulatus TaxID=1810928 RepID=UPI003CCDE5B9
MTDSKRKILRGPYPGSMLPANLRSDYPILCRLRLRTGLICFVFSYYIHSSIMPTEDMAAGGLRFDCFLQAAMIVITL